MKYNKPALSIDDQVARLVRRGMQAPDLDQARHYLLQLNYYRLRGYWLPFEHPAVRTDHEFVAGTRFEDVLSIYWFDRYFRLWLMDLIERVEVSIRAQRSHTMSMRHGPHFYLNGELFRNPRLHASCLEGLEEAVGRSHEVFIKHYLQKYTYPRLPPAWAVLI